MKWLSLGQVGRPHGVRGGFVVHWFAELDDLSELPDKVRLSRSDGQVLVASVREIKACGSVVRVAVEGIDSPEAAKAWCHAEVAVDRALVPPPAPGEHYLIDLIGMRAMNEDKQLIGDVCGLYDHGATPLLALKDITGEEKLLPLLEDTLRHVNADENHVVLRVPEDLWT